MAPDELRTPPRYLSAPGKRLPTNSQWQRPSRSTGVAGASSPPTSRLPDAWAAQNKKSVDDISQVIGATSSPRDPLHAIQLERSSRDERTQTQWDRA